MLVISLVWFAAQQQNSTLSRQKSSSVYSKFGFELSGLLLASKTHRKSLKNSKNQAMLKKRRYTYFAVKELKHEQQICKNT